MAVGLARLKNCWRGQQRESWRQEQWLENGRHDIEIMLWTRVWLLVMTTAKV